MPSKPDFESMKSTQCAQSFVGLKIQDSIRFILIFDRQKYEYMFYRATFLESMRTDGNVIFNQQW